MQIGNELKKSNDYYYWCVQGSVLLNPIGYIATIHIFITHNIWIYIMHFSNRKGVIPQFESDIPANSPMSKNCHHQSYIHIDFH